MILRLYFVRAHLSITQLTTTNLIFLQPNIVLLISLTLIAPCSRLISMTIIVWARPITQTLFLTEHISAPPGLKMISQFLRCISNRRLSFVLIMPAGIYPINIWTELQAFITHKVALRKFL